MAQTVNVIGYGPITFPDGMSREQMAEALKKLPPLPGTAAPAVPAAPQTVMEKLSASPVGGVVRGLRDVAEGTAQFAARGAALETSESVISDAGFCGTPLMTFTTPVPPTDGIVV